MWFLYDFMVIWPHFTTLLKILWLTIGLLQTNYTNYSVILPLSCSWVGGVDCKKFLRRKKKAFRDDSMSIILNPVLAGIGITGRTESRMWEGQLWPPSVQFPFQSSWVGLSPGHSNSHISTFPQSCLKLCTALPSQTGYSVSQGAEVRDPRCRGGLLQLGCGHQRYESAVMEQEIKNKLLNTLN